jgi:hypothetical protein
MWIILVDSISFGVQPVSIFENLVDAITDLLGKEMIEKIIREPACEDWFPMVATQLSSYRSVHLFQVQISTRIWGPSRDEDFWTRTLPTKLLATA